MSTSSRIIRPATRGDLAAIASLLTALNRIDGYDITTSAADLESILFNDISARVQMRAVVVENGASICALAIFYWGYDTISVSYGLHLADIIVGESDRRHGVGKQLFAAIAGICLSEGGKWISLTVMKKNDDAKRFYRALGMTEVAVDFFAIGPAALARFTGEK